MKILIIPDIHGRNFWKNPTEDMSQWDKVIFLGDYVDPYEGEAPTWEVIPNLQEIIALKEVYKDKVILLWGNHDLFYWCEPYRRELDHWSRHDYKRHDEIQSIFIQHNELFQWAWQYDKFLFTHAGVNNSMAKLFVEEYGEISADNINEFFSHKANQMLLACVSWYRGGSESFGSIVWADIQEHYGKTPIKQLQDMFQIFGHTYARVRIITKYFAMLDTGDSWSYLENGILRDEDNNKLKLIQLYDQGN